MSDCFRDDDPPSLSKPRILPSMRRRTYLLSPVFWFWSQGAVKVPFPLLFLYGTSPSFSFIRGPLSRIALAVQLSVDSPRPVLHLIRRPNPDRLCPATHPEPDRRQRRAVPHIQNDFLCFFARCFPIKLQPLPEPTCHERPVCVLFPLLFIQPS